MYLKTILLLMLICWPVNALAITKENCPDKVVSGGSFQGIYTGVECGDFCYASFKLPSGEEISIICDEDEAEKMFRKNGQMLTVNYDSVQLWNEYGEVCQQTMSCTTEKKPNVSKVD